jgi:hypothetical protein
MCKKARIDRKSDIKVLDCNMIKNIQSERFITESEGSVKLSFVEVE